MDKVPARRGELFTPLASRKYFGDFLARVGFGVSTRRDADRPRSGRPREPEHLHNRLSMAFSSLDSLRPVLGTFLRGSSYQ